MENIFIRKQSTLLVPIRCCKKKKRTLTPLLGDFKEKKEEKLLNDLGFISNSSQRPLLPCHEVNKETAKRTIGIMDFWRFQDKTKFLKSRGLWQAYKEILYQKHAVHLICQKNSRNPSSPYKMDLNADKRADEMNKPTRVQRNSACKSAIRLSMARISPISLPNHNDKSKILEKVREKCDNLALENKNTMHSVKTFQKYFLNELQKSKSLTNRIKRKSQIKLLYS